MLVGGGGSMRGEEGEGKGGKVMLAGEKERWVYCRSSGCESQVARRVGRVRLWSDESGKLCVCKVGGKRRGEEIMAEGVGGVIQQVSCLINLKRHLFRRWIQEGGIKT